MCSCRHITSNPQYADSAAYAGKFRQLQARAMAAVRAKVQQVLRHAMEQVSSFFEGLAESFFAPCV